MDIQANVTNEGKIKSTEFLTIQDIAIRIAELVDAYTNYISGQFSRAPDLGDRLAELYRSLTAVYTATRPFLIKSAKKLNKMELIRVLDGLTNIDPNVKIKEVKSYVLIIKEKNNSINNLKKYGYVSQHNDNSNKRKTKIEILYGKIVGDLFILLEESGIYSLADNYNPNLGLLEKLKEIKF